MRLIAFTVVGLIAMLVAHAFGLGGAVAAIVFLFVLFNGLMDRWARPLFERLRA